MGWACAENPKTEGRNPKEIREPNPEKGAVFPSGLSPFLSYAEKLETGKTPVLRFSIRVDFETDKAGGAAILQGVLQGNEK